MSAVYRAVLAKRKGQVGTPFADTESCDGVGGDTLKAQRRYIRKGAYIL
jgi:hypothetical protein